MASKSWLLAAGLLCAPHTAFAQDVPTAERCRAWLASLPNLPLDGPPSAVSGAGPDTCRYEGVAVKTDSHSGYRADTLVVRGIGLDPAATSGPAMTLRAEARGVRHTYHVGNPVTEYLLSQQQQPTALELTLDVTRDPVAKTWALNELSLDGERIGRVSVDAEVDGVGPIADPHTPPPGADAIAVRRIHGRMDSKVFVAFYVLPTILSRLPHADTVDAVEAAVRAQEADLAEQARSLMMEAGSSSATIDAVRAAIMDFPHPSHPFELTMTAAEPITLRELDVATRAPDGLVTLAKRVVVEATYAGAFDR